MLPIRLDIPDDELHDFSHRWKISELALFGSVIREDFRADSDIDILVTFAPDAHWTLFDMVAMQDELEAIFGRPVDLIERRAVEQSENYIRRKNILDSAEMFYVA